MNEESLIYGLELQARTLTSIKGELDKIGFLIGTQSLKAEYNQVHQIEYEDDFKPLKTTVYKYTYGDICKLNASPKNAKVIALCYGSLNDGKYQVKSMIGNLKQSEKNCEYFVEEVVNLKNEPQISNSNFVNTEFNVNNEHILGSVLDKHVITWDLNKNCVNDVLEVQLDDNYDNLKCTTGKWCPSNNWNQFTIAVKDHLKSYDLRNGNLMWTIMCKHANCVRDFDFNLNKQFIVGTCGDDGLYKIWDYRYPNNWLFSRSDHTHWIWSIKFNPIYDQLVISGGSDGRMILSSAYSVSSQFQDDCPQLTHGISDGVLQTIEHEDSVYSVDWSSIDPWIMASLSYDGRLIINKVQKQYKYQIIT